MKGPVIVGAIGYQDRQVICMMPGIYRMFGCSFRRRVWRSRIVRCLLVKITFRTQRAKYFVG